MANAKVDVESFYTLTLTGLTIEQIHILKESVQNSPCEPSEESADSYNLRMAIWNAIDDMPR